nr:MAG TPA: hypothetical protein [Caudoviricetes sp.]
MNKHTCLICLYLFTDIFFLYFIGAVKHRREIVKTPQIRENFLLKMPKVDFFAKKGLTDFRGRGNIFMTVRHAPSKTQII